MANQTDKAVVEYALHRPVTEAMFGVAVIVLAIFGLVHVFPKFLMIIATFIFGIAMIYKGVVISLEYSKLLSHLSGSKLDKLELGGGMTVEIMTGITGIILSILAILHLAPEILIAVAVITFGTGSIIGSGVISRLNALKLEGLDSFNQTQSRLMQDMISAAVGTQILAGIAAIVLGILSLIGFYPITLNLVALLVLGADSILSGTTVLEKLLSNIHSS